jgi:hypothetical protein
MLAPPPTPLSFAPLADYDFGGLQRLVDVGGGNGDLLVAILHANPQLSGVLLDRPEVAAASLRRMEEEDLLDRCDVVGGDFLDRVCAGGDAYLLSRVLCDCDDEDAARVLARCRTAMVPGARLLIVDELRERDEAQLASLLLETGFDLRGVAPTGSPGGPSLAEAVAV